jgi:hypothetical protein
MLQNIEGIYCLNNVPYTGTAYVCGTQGIFFTSSEKCLSLAPDKDVIYMYEFENGIMVEF